MSASPNDKAKRTANGGIPVVATVQATRSPGVDSLSVDTLQYWPSAATGVAFSTYKVDTNNKKIVGSQIDWAGVSNGTNSITSMVRVGGAADTGNVFGDKVQMGPTADWADSFVRAFLQEHSNPNGAHSDIHATTLTTTGAATIGDVLTASNGLTAGGVISLPSNSLSPLALKKPIKARFYRGSDAVQLGGSWYVNTMNTTDYNLGGFVTSGGGIQVPYTGIYDVTGVNAYQDGDNPITLIIGFNVNSTTLPAGPWIRGNKNSNPAGIMMTRSFSLNANDVLYLFHYNGSSGNYRIVSSNSGDCSWLEIEYKGPSS